MINSQQVKNLLRNKFNRGCFWYKKILQQKKKFYIHVHGNLERHRIPFIEKFQYHKKSDTLFILGSGASVNEITHQQWSLIKQKDSVGFNNWLIHEHIPDFYMFCGPASHDEPDIHAVNEFFHNLKIKQKEYQDVKMIFKMNTDTSLSPFPFIDQVPDHLIKNFYFSPVVFLSFHDRSSLKKALQVSFHHLEKKKNIDHLHCGATVFDLIAFGVKLKFKKIVLVGIDLTTDYFFESDAYQHSAQETGLQIPNIARYNKVWNGYKEGNIHGTERSDIIGGLPISVILDELDHTILKPRNIKLYVSSVSSKLYPRFDCCFI